MYGNDHLTLDAYRLFLAAVLGGLGLMTVAMGAIACWLFRRNQRLPHLVKPRHRRHFPFRPFGR